jgi:radical SAM protein with 4Fe4S-binding SPASM domain
MECTQTKWLSNEEYLQQFSRKVVQDRIPLFGSIDLTHRCNLRCVHCYLGDQTSSRKNRDRELSTAQWISLIEEIAEAGCLYLLITGGEPLLRRDFPEIYTHAKMKGLLVTVFTNGTLITDRVLELFKDLPPHAVEISLYGTTADTYEGITRVKGSHKQCFKGIEDLLHHGINLKLKTMLMTGNRHEFYDIRNLAESYGVEFRFDAAIFPCFNGDKAPVGLRISPQEVIEKEFSDDDRARKWRDYFERTNGLPASEGLYQCGAGVTGFHIEPGGTLKPCLMVRGIEYDLLKGNFKGGWCHVMPRIREKQPLGDYLCNRCEKRALCGFCPAFFEWENGADDVRSEYLCEIGQYRSQAIGLANS